VDGTVTGDRGPLPRCCGSAFEGARVQCRGGPTSFSTNSSQLVRVWRPVTAERAETDKTGFPQQNVIAHGTLAVFRLRSNSRAGTRYDVSARSLRNPTVSRPRRAIRQLKRFEIASADKLGIRRQHAVAADRLAEEAGEKCVTSPPGPVFPRESRAFFVGAGQTATPTSSTSTPLRISTTPGTSATVSWASCLR